MAADGHGCHALLRPAIDNLVAYPCIAGCYLTMLCRRRVPIRRSPSLPPPPVTARLLKVNANIRSPAAGRFLRCWTRHETAGRLRDLPIMAHKATLSAQVRLSPASGTAAKCVLQHGLNPYSVLGLPLRIRLALRKPAGWRRNETVSRLAAVAPVARSKRGAQQACKL